MNASVTSKFLLSWLLLFSAILSKGQTYPDPLKAGFLNPPNSAKPRVWWHWMNGNISKEGIKLDLEWMNRVGIGGFQNFDAAMMTPQVVDRRMVFMTPEWKDAFKFAMTKADELGLEAAIAGSPGWSESGGPWVKPAEGMKKYVWSETRVRGGQPFSGKLLKPPSNDGPFQDIPGGSGLEAMLESKKSAPLRFYVDTDVVAYRTPDDDFEMAELQPKITSSGAPFNPQLLWDGDLSKNAAVPIAEPGHDSWIQFDFGKPVTVRSITLCIERNPNFFIDVENSPSGRYLEAGDDGQNFQIIANIPGSNAPQITISYPEITARYFRMVFATPESKMILGLDPAELGFNFPEPTEYHISELVLHTGARVNHFEEKAGFGANSNLYRFATPDVPSSSAIRKEDVVDLTSKMRADGTLDWIPPAGNWTIIRLGYSLTGIKNHPASPEGTGLEVDKLNRQDVKDYMTNYLHMYSETVGPLMGKHGLQYVISDSYEAGMANWTDGILEEFSKRRGYDPRPWLPVLTGAVVESSGASDGFLWDFRRTQADLIAENHYDQITDLLHERGMGHYGESHESRRAFIGDGMEVKRSNDVPMGAMWTQVPGKYDEQPGHDNDIRESASVAHVYGQNLVAAESLTAALAPYAWSPETLKPTADEELAMGLNRFVIHTSVHQPLLYKVPGLGLGPFGQWFTRNETWAEFAKPWVTYLARSSYMLQQGHFVADVLYYYGEDSNITALFTNSSPQIPAGYTFDYVNADALIHKLSVSKGCVVTPSGMSYRVLALDPFSKHMSLPVLRKIRDLVKTGAIVSGPKPVATPSLADDAREFAEIADQLWGAQHSGTGKVYSGKELSAVLNDLKIAPDFEYSKPRSDTKFLYVHRTLPEAEIYWVDNRSNRGEDVQANFRVSGKEPELWHPDTGIVEPVSYIIANGRTTVPLKLEPWGTVFIVFGKVTKITSRDLPVVTETQLGRIEGPWNVAFQFERGAPPQITLEKLSSWSDNPDAGVKYFSGTGTYTKRVDAPGAWFQSGSKIWLDLGDVKNIAEVTINGKSLGIVWKQPFRVDATSALRPGPNDLEIKVTNLWVNRIIGDRQPNTTIKYTFTPLPFYKVSSPLLPSGLLGPVTLIRADNRDNRQVWKNEPGM
jgi:hypothetical protein